MFFQIAQDFSWEFNSDVDVLSFNILCYFSWNISWRMNIHIFDLSINLGSLLLADSFLLFSLFFFHFLIILGFSFFWIFKTFFFLHFFINILNLRILSDLFGLLRFHSSIFSKIFIFHFNINFILNYFFINWSQFLFLIFLSILFVFLSLSSRLLIILNMSIGINIFFVDFLLLLRVDAFRRNCGSNLFFTVFNFHLGILWNYNLNILKNFFFLKR